MKKFLALSAAVAIVSSLQANMIEWSLPSLEDSKGTFEYGLNDIVFISTSGSSYNSDKTSEDYGKITGTASGSNTLIDSDEGEYVSAVWTDTVNDPTSYYMAYKGKDGTFYAFDDGSGSPVTIPAVAATPSDLIPGSNVNGKAFLADTSDTVKTVAPAVPEPATAVLALAGIAMLIRRRKA